jgi:aspartate--ammonia ligase
VRKIYKGIKNIEKNLAQAFPDHLTI